MKTYARRKRPAERPGHFGKSCLTPAHAGRNIISGAEGGNDKKSLSLCPAVIGYSPEATHKNITDMKKMLFSAVLFLLATALFAQRRVERDTFFIKGRPVGVSVPFDAIPLGDGEDRKSVV